MKIKSSIFRIHFKSLITSIVILLIEILIALYVNDHFIRPYLGDLLVVFLIYYFIKAFLHLPVWSLSVGILLFSYLIEALQYLQFLKFIGMEHHKLLNIVIGNHFSWSDLICYTIGITMVLGIETYFTRAPCYR